MLRITAFLVVSTLYIIPGNILFFNLSKATINYLLYSESSIALSLRGVPFILSFIKSTSGIAPSILYIVYTLIYFGASYFALKQIIYKMVYVYNDEILTDVITLEKYDKGQKNIDRLSKAIITIAVLAHLFLKVYDVRIFVLYILSMLFIFSTNPSSVRLDNERHEEKDGESSQENSGDGETKTYEWYYQADPLKIERPVRFTASIKVDKNELSKYGTMEHNEDSQAALRKYVTEGLCSGVEELAAQIKRECESRNYTTYQKISAAVAFQLGLKYVPDIASKGIDEYIRYPLETLAEGKGDCDSHTICSAAILYSMGLEVVILKVIDPEKDEQNHLALAVGGADGIPGDFFSYDNRKYYYCEISLKENNEGSSNKSMKFMVGEMPDMLGANITVAPVSQAASG